MVYHLEHTQLRVVDKYIRQQRNVKDLKNTRLIILEHILPSTEEFIRLLCETNAEVFKIIAKPYSIDKNVLKNLEEKGIPVERKTYKELEESDYLEKLLHAAIEESKKDNKQILIVEVGGYFAKPLSELSPECAQFVTGVVEDTTFGHNRYIRLVQDIPVPVFSVARSPLKEVEARFVGRDAGEHSLLVVFGLITRYNDE